MRELFGVGLRALILSMGLAGIYLDIVGGRAGAWAAPARWVLSAASLGYAGAVAVRNRAFDAGRREVHRLRVPVISVGNLTTGGSGKTPVVIHLLQRLVDRGRKPAVVSRGYKSQRQELGDELTLIRERVPAAIVIGDPDRVAGARRAIERGADVVVLDDAFQHRRIGRDVNICVVDALNPFGYERLLPRGLLREPPESIRRADLVVISRADVVDQAAVEALRRRIVSLCGHEQCVTCGHRVACVETLQGERCARRVQRAFLFGAIGNPDGFEATVRGMGIHVTGRCWWADHHCYGQRDIDRLSRVARSGAPDALLTTEKDAVKLGGLDVSSLPLLHVVKIDIDFHADGDRIVDDWLERALTTAGGADGETSVSTHRRE